MGIAMLLGTFVVLLLIGVPVAYALALYRRIRDFA